MAKAQVGKNYAQVVDGKCHWIFTSDDLPEWHDDLPVVDVTGQDVAQGDVWNGSSFEKPPAPAPEQIIAQYTGAVQQHLDNFARTRNYDGILSAATYATSQVPKFKAEGQYAVEARDATWAKCYEILAAVEAGSRPMPTLDELLAELPVLTWPN